jgi:putative redox protein
MTTMSVIYEGQLHCRLSHEPSGTVIATDAPKDNQGKGEAFSPTDLVGAALGACMLTIMGIYARNHDLKIEGASLKVVKGMVADPVRRIGSLTVEIHVPAGVPAEKRQALENAAHSCPVMKSIHPDIKVPTAFHYDL